MRVGASWSLAAGIAAVAMGAVGALGAAGCSSGPPPPRDTRPYAEQVLSARADKDLAFRSSEDSPIPAGQRLSFPGLAYFSVDPTYHVPAALTEHRSESKSILLIPTSKGETRREQRIGTLDFTIAGVAYTLTAFFDEDEGINRLFVPFADETNGAETYRGGRFLDLDRTPTGLYDLDFNRAYHPYCVYNPSYDCPIPPPENRLPAAIRAGERLGN